MEELRGKFLPGMLFCSCSSQPTKARFDGAPEAAAVMVEARDLWPLLVVHVLSQLLQETVVPTIRV